MTDSTSKRRPQSDSDGDELIWGAAAIGRVIKRKPRQVFHLAKIGAIPVKKIRPPGTTRGGRLCARKSALLAIAG
jgi:hypothetical protein